MNRDTVITYERVIEDADTIRECAKRMESIFDNVSSSMQSLNSNEGLVGHAGDMLFQRFNELKSRFSSYISIVNNFADTIHKAETAYEATEAKIERAGEELLQ